MLTLAVLLATTTSTNVFNHRTLRHYETTNDPAGVRKYNGSQKQHSTVATRTSGQARVGTTLPVNSNQTHSLVLQSSAE